MTANRPVPHRMPHTGRARHGRRPHHVRAGARADASPANDTSLKDNAMTTIRDLTGPEFKQLSGSTTTGDILKWMYDSIDSINLAIRAAELDKGELRLK